VRRVIPFVLVIAVAGAVVWWIWLRPDADSRPGALPSLRPRPTASATPATPGFDRARSDANRLPVKGWDRQVDFRRSAFGEAWSDDVNVEFGHNGCNTRDDVLRRDLVELVVRPGTCFAQSGTLHDPYTGQTIAFVRGPNSSDTVQIDHVVSLSDAWYKGARLWDDQRRRDFANDPRNLLAVGGKANFDKAFRDAASWLPPDAAFRCAFVARVVDVKTAYGLTVSANEKRAITDVLSGC
jgi:hypothetical protein